VIRGTDRLLRITFVDERMPVDALGSGERSSSRDDPACHGLVIEAGHSAKNGIVMVPSNAVGAIGDGLVVASERDLIFADLHDAHGLRMVSIRDTQEFFGGQPDTENSAEEKKDDESQRKEEEESDHVVKASFSKQIVVLLIWFPWKPYEEYSMGKPSSQHGFHGNLFFLEDFGTVSKGSPQRSRGALSLKRRSVMTTSEEAEHGEKKRQESTQLIEQIIQLNIRMMQQQEEGDRERMLMLRKTKGQAFADLLQSMTITALHVLSTIGRYEPINGIQIARELGITKGAVSKIARKLLEQQLIVAEQLPDNKKHIYFRLTAQGREIFHWHQTLHEELEGQAKQFLERYTLEELRLIVRFLQEYVEKR
jgi:DNA-binding MarR family transcriptional regulator